MPLALFIRNLYEIIIERLKNLHSDPLPFNIHIPSNE